MVAVRRVKRFVKLSLFLLLVASIVLLVQWNRVPYADEISRQRKDFSRRVFTDEKGTLEGRHGLDVGNILQDFIERAKTRDGTQTTVQEQEQELNPTVSTDHQEEATRTENLESDLSIVREENAHPNNHHSHDQDKKRNLKQLPSDESGLQLQPSVPGGSADKTTAREITGNVTSEARAESTEGKRKNSHAGHVDDGHIHWKKFPWKVKMLGKLNVHVWQAWCGSSIHDLRRNPFFPRYPDVHLTTKKLSINHMEVNYGQRVFGYVHPPVTGEYTFAISSDDSSELWLSSDDNPVHVRLLAWVGNTSALSGVYRTHPAEFTKYNNQLSRPVYLKQGQKYFIEVLHKQSKGREHLLVGWKVPGLEDFRQLTRKAISLFIDDAVSKDITVYAQYIPEDLPSHSHSKLSGITLNKRVHQFGAPDPRDSHHKASLIKEADISNAFPSCSYKPSYLVKFRLERYDGVKLIHDTSVFPDDHSELKHMREYDSCAHRRLTDSHGNNVLDLPVGFVSNHSLYVNGSIKIFSSEHSAVLDFSKDAEDDAGGLLLERQLDLLDMQKAADVQVMSRNSKASGVAQQTKDSLKFKTVARKDSSATENPRTEVRTRSITQIEKKKSTAAKQQLGKKTESAVSRKSRAKRSAETQGGHVVKARKAESSRKTGRQKKSSVTSIKSRKLLSISPKRVTDSQATKANARRKKEKSINKKVDSSSANATPVQTSRTVERDNATRPPKSHRTFATRPYYQYNYGPLDNEDARLSRLVSARQYVYLMQQGAQNYLKNLSAEALAEQVWRRFRVRLKVPDVFHVPDHSKWLFHQNRTSCASDGNMRLHPEVARSVVQRVVRGLTRKHLGKYSLKTIVNVEENHDVLRGDRYLVEVDLNVKGQNSSVRLSRYFYQKIQSTTLCQPSGFQMNHHSTVHIIIPVKDQGKWVQFLIDDLSQLYQDTHDLHVNIIIVDFESEDIDISAALKRSSLQRYQLKKLSGPFQRAYGIQAGARLVSNPHDIIFMCDLHLKMPSNMIGIIRKHCVEGKMAFAPIVMRLHCGFTPFLPYGFWELQGYGLFAMYKSDFDRVGGMNVEEFGTRWGGEDWELLDRVLEKKMEVERLRVPKFYHFYHSKQGMWGNTNDLQYSDTDWAEYDSGSDVITPYDGTEDDNDFDEADMAEEDDFDSD